MSIRIREGSKFDRAQPDHDSSLEHADRRRHRTGIAHRRLTLFGDFEIGWRRKTVNNDCRFERDDVAALFKCVGDFVVDHDRGVSKVSHAMRKCTVWS